MIIQLDSIKPSPYNPKQPLSKKQYTALKRNVETYGFQRDLLVCKDFTNNGEGYICLDGHTAIELLKDLGKTETDCKVVENVVDEKTLKEFITGYAISKKPLINEMFKELGNDFEDLFGKSAKFLKGYEEIDYSNLKQESEAMQKQYFLTLPPETVKKLKSFVKTKAFKENKEQAIMDKIDSCDEKKFLTSVIIAMFDES